MTNIYVHTFSPSIVALTVVESFTTRTIADTAIAFTRPERVEVRAADQRLEGFSAPETIYVAP